ncbi:RNA polymerase sigma-54 factor [Dirofilaria immitis]
MAVVDIENEDFVYYHHPLSSSQYLFIVAQRFSIDAECFQSEFSRDQSRSWLDVFLQNCILQFLAEEISCSPLLEGVRKGSSGRVSSMENSQLSGCFCFGVFRGRRLLPSLRE